MVSDYYKYWDKNDFIFPAISLDAKDVFSRVELDFIENVGVPEWVAPNVMFYSEFSVQGDLVLLCEDRDDRVIGINRFSKKVEFASDLGAVCNSSFEKFIESLFAYAEFIDEATSLDPDAFLKKNIGSELLDKIKNKMNGIDGLSCSDGAFWSDEIFRIGSRKSKA